MAKFSGYTNTISIDKDTDKLLVLDTSDTSQGVGGTVKKVSPTNLPALGVATLAAAVGRGDTASKPAANTVPAGTLYFDTTLVKMQRSNGTDWQDVEGAGGGGGGAVDSVNSQTGTVVLTQDNIGDGTTYKQYSQTEKTKLAGIATGATANDSDANLKNRANHTGTQSADTITDGSTNKVFTSAEQSKLTGIAAGAQVNTVTSVAGRTGAVTLAKGDVGLGNVVNADTTTTANITDSTNKRFMTDAQESKLDGVEAGADVTDAANVAAAGAVMDTGDETIAGVKTFSSSPIVPTPTTDMQAATKKYVDDNAGGGGGVTLSGLIGKPLYFDELIYYPSLSNHFYIRTGDGGEVGQSSVYAVKNMDTPGQIYLRCGNLNSNASLCRGSNYPQGGEYYSDFLIGRPVEFVYGAGKVSALSTSTERYVLRVGAFYTQNDDNSGLYFRYVDDVNSGNWECVARNGGSETVLNSSVPPSTTTYQHFKITDDGTTARFYINGTQVGSGITTNRPTTSIAPFAMSMKKTATSANTNIYALIDYWGFEVDLTRG
jgi:hypothetical protein